MKDDDAMFRLLQEIDDDLIEKEVDIFMKEIDFDMESIQKKALAKIEPPAEKKPKRRPFIFKLATAACIVFVATAAIHGQAIKNFINASFVDDTMRMGDAYYLAEPLPINDNITLAGAELGDHTLSLTFLSGPTWYDDAEDGYVYIEMDGEGYPVGGYTTGGGFDETLQDATAHASYHMYFYQIPHQESFNLVIGGEVYPVTLTMAERAQHKDIIFPLEPAQPVLRAEGVEVGAIFEEEAPQMKVSLLTSFEDPDLLWDSYFAMEAVHTTSQVVHDFIDGKASIMHGTTFETEREVQAYIFDDGKMYDLALPEGKTSMDVAQFYAPLPTGNQAVLRVEKVAGYYKDSFEALSLPIPETGVLPLDISYDLKQQIITLDTIERISEDQVRILMTLNCVENNGVKIARFNPSIENASEYTYVISDDACELIATIDLDEETLSFCISWPGFYFEGHWEIPVQLQ